MESEKQNSGVPPGRPPPPFYPSAPPPYIDPQGGTYPMGQPGGAPPYGAPPPAYYTPPPNQTGYPPPGGYQAPPNQFPQGYPGGQSMYPDISQLPQPQAGTVPYTPFAQHVALPIGAMYHPYSMPFPWHHPMAPLEPPPAYEGCIAPTNHPNLHAGIPSHAQTFEYAHPSSGHPASAQEKLPALADNPQSRVEAAKHSVWCSDASYSSTNMNDSWSSFRSGDLNSNTKIPLGFGPAGGHPGGPDPTQVPGGPLTGPSPVPVRPAPGPPIHSPADPALQGAPYSNQGQVSWWSNLKDGEAPPGCVISWKGGAGLKIYFLQEEGHIVSPKKSLEMSVYKKINGKGVVEENLLGMVEVLGCWRLRLHGKSSICLHTYNDTYVFLDDSTCPRRIVIIELPHDVSSTMRADLLALVQEMSDTREEQEGVVGKITTNVGSVYTDITKKLNTAVKDVVPGAHKSTKWLRKGTGNLVRFGGNLVSKGMHLIADQMPAGQTEQHEEESPFHSELMEGLMKFQKAVESGSINYV